MELHQLRRFAVLAEELHFTRAAERLHIEQPPLSRTIRELEDELGAALFYRNHHHTRLTAAGNALLHKTRRVLTVLDQAREEVKAVASGLQGSLHIAVSDHVIDVRLAALLLLAHKAILRPMLVDNPLILYDQQHCEGYYRELVYVAGFSGFLLMQDTTSETSSIRLAIAPACFHGSLLTCWPCSVRKSRKPPLLSMKCPAMR